MNKYKATFTWLFIPLAIYLGLMALLFIERTGASYEITEPTFKFLEVDHQPLPSGYTDPEVESLLLYDGQTASETEIPQAFRDVLDNLRVRYDQADVNTEGSFEFNHYKTVILAFQDLTKLQQLHELVEWVRVGGRVLIATPLNDNENFSAIYRKVGILSIGDDFTEVTGVAFTSDLFPGANGMRLEGAPDFLNSSSRPVKLEPEARIHITSADEYDLPLLWDMDYEQGRFVVLNTYLFSNRDNRGVLGAAYTRLFDIFIHPVINSSVIFIDDFPAQIPEGESPVLTAEFNRDIRNFLLYIWWPDMQKLAEKYQLRYTGLLIESYNDRIHPPFELDVPVDDQRYLGRMLLNKGGEIGLHGYNHVPFCKEKDGINYKLEYREWPNDENPQMAMLELNRLANELFPGQNFNVYVPPSNILCPEARAWLPKVLPNIRVISSLLVEGEEVDTYKQDFLEADDGVLEFPRITSGYTLYEDGWLALINGLSLYYVNSLFIHPDDILDPARRDDRTWAQMREQLEEQMAWLNKNVPLLRPMTATDGGKALQRYHRLKVNATLNENTYTIHIGNFYDEAWLLLRSESEPVSIAGGSITKVNSSTYLIKADQPDLSIQLRK